MCLPSVKGVWERMSYAADTYRSTLRIGWPRSYEFPHAAGRPVRSTVAASAGNRTPILRAMSLSFDSTGLWRWYITHYLPFLDSVRCVISEEVHSGSRLCVRLQARKAPTVSKGSHSIGDFFARRRKKSLLPKRHTSTITRCTKTSPPQKKEDYASLSLSVLSELLLQLCWHSLCN